MRSSADPPAILKADLELVGNCVRGSFRAPFEGVFAARLTVVFKPPTTIRPTGFAVAIATAAGTTIPGVLLPEDVSVPEPRFAPDTVCRSRSNSGKRAIIDARVRARLRWRS